MPQNSYTSPMDYTRGALIAIKSDGAICGANAAARALTGCTEDELATRRIDDLLPGLLNANSTGKGRRFGPNLAEGSREPFATDLLRKDGVRQPVHAQLEFASEREDAVHFVHVRRAVLDEDENFHFPSERIVELDENLVITRIGDGEDSVSGPLANILLGKAIGDPPLLVESSEHRRILKDALENRACFCDIVVHATWDMRDLYFNLGADPVTDDDNILTGYRGVITDLATFRQTADHLSRLRAYFALLSEIDHAIIHSRTAVRLFEATCKAVVKSGHFLFSWIGLVNNITNCVEPVAHSGEHRNFPDDVRISTVHGDSPVLDILWTGEPFVTNEAASAASSLLIERFPDRPIRSFAIFPLRNSGKVVGTFHLYSVDSNAFDDDLLQLLSQVSENLSFAIGQFEQQTAREHVERALRESEKRFRDIADVAGEYVWENDLKGRFTYLSSRVRDFLGYGAHELLGRSPAVLMRPDERTRVREWITKNVSPNGTFRGLENQILHKSGDIRWQRVSGVPLFDSKGQCFGYRGTAQDITELKLSEERIINLATRDALTGYPNRILFNDRLQQSIENAQRVDRSVAVLFIDLDRFKTINDSLGHSVGDRLLKEVAIRMDSCIRSGDTLARIGGDEFVIALAHLRNPADAGLVAKKIVSALSRRFEVDGQYLNTSCSIGISLFPGDAHDPDTLLKNADTAMYHAKERGRNNFQFFSTDMNVRALVRHEVEVELRRAIENDEFELLYQPQMTVADSHVVGAEALLRWRHPQRGLVAPGDFIQIAEESGLIEPIGRWVFRAACKQIKQWNESGMPSVKIAVNVSTRQLLDPGEFLRFISETIEEADIDPSQIELEMTESLLLAHVEDSALMLRQLGQTGIRIAVDDFGTGYSSLAYLKRLPIDTIKIDRTFVRDIESDADDVEIIKAIIAMAHGLKLRVTAEGVETTSQLQTLQSLSCDEYQGYLVSKPIEASRFAERFLEPSLSEDSGFAHLPSQPLATP